MADNTTTGAVHLTSLDLDISGVKNSLQTVRSEIDETVKYIRESMSSATSTKSTSGTSSGIMSNMKKEAKDTEESLTVVTNTIQKMESQYLSLQKKIETFRITNQASGTDFERVSQEVESALSVLSQYRDETEKVITVEKDEKETLNSLQIQLQSLKNDLQAIDNELLKSGEAWDKQVSKITSIEKGYYSLISTLKNSKLDKESEDYKNLFSSVEKGAESFSKLSETIKSTGTIADTQLKEINSYKSKLDDLKLTHSKLKSQIDQTNESMKKSKDSEPDFSKYIKSVETLATNYSKFLTSLSTDSSKYTEKVFGNIPESARKANEEVTKLLESIRASGTTTEEQAKKIDELDLALKRMITDLTASKESAQRTGEGLKSISDNVQFDKISASISNVTKKLIEMENSAKNSQIKNSAKELRTQFDSLYNSIKSGNISVNDAKSKFDELNGKFGDLTTQAKNANSGIQGFLLRLADKAKWMVTYQLIMLVRNAFNSVISTIKDTEDSVVELQKVLGDKSLSGVEISDQLYDISYRYGQTFDVVQEAAVLFAQTGQNWSEVINSVEATMLALNAAELDVSTATQGLIAIMTQFKIEAEDLETVIDKINVTSDKFPVTSEKIVAALQRAGSTAYNYGLSLEETIGIVAALGETTGRTGEAIGTALNSLITFSMKESSLKKFSEYLGGLDLSDKNVLEIWALLGAKIDDTGDSMAKMMASSEEFADLFNEELATAIGLTDEYNAAVMNAQDVYSAVGTYRQNYFIALLNDISSAVEALEYMDDVTGYTQKKNAQYLETLTAKWNQLVATAKEMTVSFGDAGFKDLLKWLVQSVTGVLKLTEKLGGLNTVIGALIIVLLKIKATRVADVFDTLRLKVMFLGDALKHPITSLKSLASGFGSFITSVAGVSSALVGLYVLYNNGVNRMKEYREAQQSAREEAISLASESRQESVEIAELIKKYKSAKDALSNNSGTKEELSQITAELLKALGYEEEQIESLTQAYGGLSSEMEEVLEKTKDEAIIEQTEALQAAVASLWDVAQKDLYEDVYPVKQYYSTVEEGIDAIIKKHEEDIEKRDEMRKKAVEAGKEEELINSKEYQSLVDNIEKREDYVAQIKEITESLETLKGNTDDASDSSNDLSESMDGVGEAIAGATLSAEEMEEELERLSDVYDEISGKVDDFQSAYSDIVDIIDEYNETGNMTADMLQTLMEMEPEYLSILENKNGVLSINQDQLDNLIALNDDYIVRLAAVRIAEEAETMAKELQAIATENLTEAEIEARLKTIALQSSTEQAAYAYLTGQSSANDFRVALNKVASDAGLATTAQDTLTNSIMASTDAYKDFIKMAGIAGDAANSYANIISTLPSLTSTLGYNPFTPGGLPEISLSGVKEYQAGVSSLKSAYEKLQSAVKSANSAGSSVGSNSGIGTYYTPKSVSSSSGNSGSSGSSAAKTAAELLEEQIKELDSAFDEMIGDYEHQIFLMEKNNAPIDAIVSVYKKMQNAAHEQAEIYRKLGLEENSDYLQELQKQWWTWSDAIEDIYADQLSAMSDAIDEVMTDYEHQIFLMEKNKKNPSEIADLYKKMQLELHELAEKYRAMGLAENSDYIQELQKQWWEYQEAIEEIYSDMYDNLLATHENAIKLLQYQYNVSEGNQSFNAMSANLEKQRDEYIKIMNEAHEEAERLRKLGADENDDAIQSLIDTWWSAYNAVQDINSKIEDSVLSVYDDFISLADSLDVWDSLDFTKVDYLKEELEDINNLYKDGIITLKEYKQLLQSVGVSLFNAQKELLEKQSEQIQDYYNNLISGYESEIEEIKKLQSESDDYYDSLIENLNKVQESNDRINEQLDYYASRQKILTSLEQAQSRSGIEWREKEMEYQQQLIDLDEDWRRKMEDWSVSDQLEELEQLKQAASDQFEESIERINGYIEEAQKASEAALDRVSQQVDALRNKIFHSLTDVLSEDAENVGDSIISALDESEEAIQSEIENLGKGIEEVFEQGFENIGEIAEAAAKETYNVWEKFFVNPFLSSIDTIGDTLRSKLAEDATTGAVAMTKAFKTSFIQPMQNEIAAIMSDAMSKTNSFGGQLISTGNPNSARMINTSTVANIYANIGSPSSANSTVNSLSSFLSNPRRF